MLDSVVVTGEATAQVEDQIHFRQCKENSVPGVRKFIRSANIDKSPSCVLAPWFMGNILGDPVYGTTNSTF